MGIQIESILIVLLLYFPEYRMPTMLDIRKNIELPTLLVQDHWCGKAQHTVAAQGILVVRNKIKQTTKPGAGGSLL
jgi:hypothetical protein